jgi:hypothetical protein
MIRGLCYFVVFCCLFVKLLGVFFFASLSSLKASIFKLQPPSEASISIRSLNIQSSTSVRMD